MSTILDTIRELDAMSKRLMEIAVPFAGLPEHIIGATLRGHANDLARTARSLSEAATTAGNTGDLPKIAREFRDILTEQEM